MSKRIRVIVSWTVMILLVFLFNNSLYWGLGGLSKRRLVVIGLSILGVTLVPMLFSFVHPFDELLDSWILWFAQLGKKFIKERKAIFRKCIVYLLALLAAGMLEFLVFSRNQQGINACRMIYWMGMLACAVSLFFMRKIAAQKTELVFAVTALIIGGTFIISSPIHIGVTWDDETHYSRVASMASVFDGIKYNADAKMINDNAYFVYGYQDGSITYETLQDYYAEINAYYSHENINSDTMYYETDAGIYSVAFIPHAIAIIIAKGLGLPYTYIFLAGKLAGLLAYILIIYHAIKKLKTGKILMSVFALSPTLFFQASSYSYDAWVVAWIIAGYAFFISELQNKENFITMKNTAFMVLCFVLGAMPKAIYFVLMFPLLFMPKEKFASKKDRKQYYLWVVIGAVLLAASFILPRMIGGMGTGDTRGGSDINAGGQLAYILANPIAFIKTFFTFFLSYVRLDNCSGYLTYMGYLGIGKHAVLVLTEIIVLCFLDRGEEKVKYPFVRIAAFVGAFGAVSLAIVAMYISFTAVGADYVAGCQYRYMLPAIFPFLYFVGVDGIKSKMNQNALAITAIALVSLVFMLNYGTLYIFNL